MQDQAISLDRIHLHLAHFRGEMPGHDGIPPRVQPDWMVLLPLHPHRLRCPLGERAADGPVLYLIPPRFPFAMEMTRYHHYSAHFSESTHRGWSATVESKRTASDLDWPQAQMSRNPETLKALGASWKLVNPAQERGDLLAAFDRLMDAYLAGDRFRSVAALLALLDRLPRDVRGEPGKLQRFADHLAFRAHQQTTVATLARACGMSRMHLHRECLRVYGTSPKELLLRERLAIASRQLENGASVAQAAKTAGFDDPFYFSRLFTKRQGRPPSRWQVRS